MIWHWLSTAFSTYVLHPEHNDGYQWWSGPGSDLGLAGAVIVFALKHNCYEHGCPRIARVVGQDGHSRCKRHHNLKP